jgi:UDP-glucose 4-epimerase
MSVRVLVTGSSGFIGAALTSTLSGAGHCVRAASRGPGTAPDLPGVERIKLPDLEEEVDWAPLLSGMDAVIHLAAIAHRSHIDSSQYEQVNRVASANLARACAEHGIRRVIFMSSISAQAGSAADYVVTENDDPYPVTSYDRAKLAAEEEIRRSGVSYTILRPVIVYGPGAKANIAAMVRIASLPVPLPFGSFKNRRSLLSIDNLMQAVMFCLDNPGTIDRTFIVSDLEPITVSEMFATLREAAGRPPNLIRVPPTAVRALVIAVGSKGLWDRIGRDLVASSACLQKMGWSPQVETKAGLRAMMKAGMSFKRGPSK